MPQHLSHPDVGRAAEAPAASLLLELLRRLSACVAVYAPDGTCLAASASLGRWLDRPAESLVGKDVGDVWPGEFGRRQFQRLSESLGGGVIQSLEEFPSPLGWRSVRVVRSAWRDGGELLGVVELFEEQPGPAGRDETVGRLALGIAHDVSNALTLVQGHADLVAAALARGDGPPLEGLRQAADHASQLPRQLLQFARGSPSEVRRVDLNVLLGSVEGLIRPRLAAGSGEVAVRQEFSPAGAWVEGDPVQLTQVFLNLASNAVESMPGGGELTLRTERFGSAVRVTVADTGPGQGEEGLSRPFEPQPADPASRLDLVRDLVRRHGGRIARASEAGRGTTYWIDLPLRRESGLAAPPPAEGGVVLVVEREPDVRRLTGMILAQGGYESVLAADLEEGRRQVEVLGGRVKLALLDAELSAARGEEELSSLLEALAGAKVLYLSTGHVFAPLQPEDRRVVSKPFRGEQLLRAVESALAGA
jgi:signal transduction histidine kinase/CheY-like chemotaxis protein